MSKLEEIEEIIGSGPGIGFEKYLLSLVKRYGEANRLFREASFQNHSGHWDRTGQHGANCPEYARAKDLRTKADKLLGEPEGGKELK